VARARGAASGGARPPTDRAPCRELGDGASAELKFDAARSALEELGARPDLERLAGMAGSPRPGRLSPRESEVLTLVAAGKTNHAIAAELFISDETVARHVSNNLHEAAALGRAVLTNAVNIGIGMK
jgi:DNA-binding NarL/FixJ family response regulator